MASDFYVRGNTGARPFQNARRSHDTHMTEVHTLHWHSARDIALNQSPIVSYYLSRTRKMPVWVGVLVLFIRSSVVYFVIWVEQNRACGHAQLKNVRMLTLRCLSFLLIHIGTEVYLLTQRYAYSHYAYLYYHCRPVDSISLRGAVFTSKLCRYQY